MRNFDFFRIGDNIKFYRKRLGLTQLELAMDIGTCERQVRRYESGDISNLKVIEMFANYFNVAIEDILFVNHGE